MIVNVATSYRAVNGEGKAVDDEARELMAQLVNRLDGVLTLLMIERPNLVESELGQDCGDVMVRALAYLSRPKRKPEPRAAQMALFQESN